jgi:hypothetical protein
LADGAKVGAEPAVEIVGHNMLRAARARTRFASSHWWGDLRIHAIQAAVDATGDEGTLPDTTGTTSVFSPPNEDIRPHRDFTAARPHRPRGRTNALRQALVVPAGREHDCHRTQGTRARSTRPLAAAREAEAGSPAAPYRFHYIPSENGPDLS